MLLSFVREILWGVGRWKNERLRNYLSEVDPQVIFSPVYGCFYPHKLLKYVYRYTRAPLLLFHADDNYTLRQFSLSPLFWIYRLILRKWVRKSVSLSKINYAISDLQKREYENIFQREFKVLTKSEDFSSPPELKTAYLSPVQLVFTGNIHTNRWKTLAMIASALKRLHTDGIQAQLRIYTATPLTAAMRKVLDIPSVSFLMGSVPAEEIADIQRCADILVHVEAMDLKSRLAVRQSFSTKLVDYFKMARPILAVGPKQVASIDYLVQNRCAITAEREDELTEKLKEALLHPEKLSELAQRAHRCGRDYHDRNRMETMLREDFRLAEETR